MNSVPFVVCGVLILSAVICSGGYIPSDISPSINASKRLSVLQSNNWTKLQKGERIPVHNAKQLKQKRKLIHSKVQNMALNKLPAIPVRNILESSNDGYKWLSYQKRSRRNFYHNPNKVNHDRRSVIRPKSRKNYEILTQNDARTHINKNKYFSRQNKYGMNKNGVKYNYLNGEMRTSTNKVKPSDVNQQQSYFRHPEIYRPRSNIALSDDPSNFNNFPTQQNLNTYPSQTVNTQYDNKHGKQPTGTLVPVENYPQYNANSNQYISVPFKENNELLEEQSRILDSVEQEARDRQEKVRWIISNTVEQPLQIRTHNLQNYYYPQLNSTQQVAGSIPDISGPNFYIESSHPPMEKSLTSETSNFDNLSKTYPPKIHQTPIGNKIIDSILEEVHQPPENVPSNHYEQYAKSLTYDTSQLIDDGGLHASWGIPPTKSEIEQVYQGELQEGHDNVISGRTKYREDIKGQSQNSDTLDEKLVSERRLNNASEPLTSNSYIHNSQIQEENFPINELTKVNPHMELANSQNNQEDSFHEQKQILPYRPSNKSEQQSRQNSEIKGQQQNNNTIYEKLVSETRFSNVSKPLTSNNYIHNSQIQKESFAMNKLTKLKPHIELANNRNNQRAKQENSFHAHKQISPYRPSNKSKHQSRQRTSKQLTSNSNNHNSQIQEEIFPMNELTNQNPRTELANNRNNQRAKQDSFHEQKQTSPYRPSNKSEQQSRQRTAIIPEFLAAGKQGSVQFLSPTGPGRPSLRVITLGNGGSFQLPEGIKIQSGHEIPGTMGLKVPAGFRAHVIFGSEVADSIKNAHTGIMRENY